MQLWAILPLVALLTSALTGIWALIKNPRNPVNFAFGVWMLFFALWNLGEVGVLTSATASGALFWSKIGYIGVLLLPPSYAYFAFRLVGRKFSAALLLPFVAFSLLLPTDLLIKNIVYGSWEYGQEYGLLYPLFGAAALLLTAYALLVLLKARREVPGASARRRLELLMLPITIPLLAIPSEIFSLLGEFTDIVVRVLSAAMALVIAYALVLKK